MRDSWHMNKVLFNTVTILFEERFYLRLSLKKHLIAY